ncbi:hypothetical protein D3C72_1803200 [compost metagenome]
MSMAFLKASCSFCTIFGSVPLGATSPNGEVCTMPMPSSFRVGTLGKRAERFSPQVDSRRSLPCSTYGAHAGVSATDITWPPSRACIDSELPL